MLVDAEWRLRKSPSQSRREQTSPAELVHVVDLDEMSNDSDDDVKSHLNDSETLAHVLEELPKLTPAAHARECSMSRSSKSKADDSQPYLRAGAAAATRRSKLSSGCKRNLYGTVLLVEATVDV